MSRLKVANECNRPNGTTTDEQNTLALYVTSHTRLSAIAPMCILSYEHFKYDYRLRYTYSLCRVSVHNEKNDTQ